MYDKNSLGFRHSRLIVRGEAIAFFVIITIASVSWVATWEFLHRGLNPSIFMSIPASSFFLGVNQLSVLFKRFFEVEFIF